jgi:hypothetical protein
MFCTNCQKPTEDEMPFNLEENRKEPRILIKFAATLQWLDHAGKEISDDTFTDNISNSGAGFITGHQPHVGARINVNFDIEGKFGSSVGEVRWSETAGDRFRIGVSFKR